MEYLILFNGKLFFFAFRALKIAFYHGNVFFIIVFVVEKEVDQ